MPDREALFAEPNVAVLVTIRKDGRPHATPVWYLYENGEFVLTVSATSAKRKHVERDPRVSLVIDRRQVPYFAVTVEGTATVEQAMTGDERQRIASRYLGPEEGARYARELPAANTVTLRIRPERFWEFGHAGNDVTRFEQGWHPGRS